MPGALTFTTTVDDWETSLDITKPSAYKDIISRMLQMAQEKHGGYLTVTLSLPHRPRTIGRYSQSNHFHGHCRCIAAQTGNSVTAVKERMKELAVDIGQWREEVLPDGGRIPQSESLASVEEESAIIEVVHQFAAEWQLPLVEEDW